MSARLQCSIGSVHAQLGARGLSELVQLDDGETLPEHRQPPALDALNVPARRRGELAQEPPDCGSPRADLGQLLHKTLELLVLLGIDVGAPVAVVHVAAQHRMQQAFLRDAMPTTALTTRRTKIGLLRVVVGRGGAVQQLEQGATVAGCVALGATPGPDELTALLGGQRAITAHQHDLIAQALNDHFVDRGQDHLVRYSYQLDQV